jgi:hypothetical protein
MIAVTAENRSGARRWILWSAALVVLAIAVIITLLALNWPFTQAAVTKTLEDRFARQVTIYQFRSTYFPPGCIAEGVDFLPRKRTDLPPLISIQTVTLRGSYSGLLRFHKLINHVQIAGLHIRVPQKNPNATQQTFPLTNSVSGKTLTIGEISTDAVVLDFLDKDPRQVRFSLRIDHLTLDNVGQNDPVTFHTRFNNTEPPGEIRSDGQFGPWNEDDPGTTKVSGAYTYQHVNLGVFSGISGTLSSQGKFGGTLGQIDARGDIDIPDFAVSGATQKEHLASSYQAVVDGTNGDTSLTRVDTHFGRTTVVSKGDVKGQPGQAGKTVRLSMSVPQGRIEDLLRLITGSAPAEAGNVQVQTKLELPPGPQPFLRRLRLDGHFGIGNERFTDPQVQQPVNRLAESARGEKKPQEEADRSIVLSDLKGRVSTDQGIAKLFQVSFTEPGTLAQFDGTFNMLNKKVDLHGELRTHGKLADTKSGFKSLVLKAISPLVKKRSMTVVTFNITGTSSNPSFSLDLTAKR